MKQIYLALTILLVLIAAAYCLQIIWVTGFFGAANTLTPKFLIFAAVYFLILILSSKGLVKLYRSDTDQEASQYFLSAFVIPAVLLLGTFVFGKMDFDNETAARKVSNEKFIQEHCVKVDRPNYYYYKCDNGSSSVPDEFVQYFLNDESK
jgi:hypothetical protein